MGVCLLGCGEQAVLGTLGYIGLAGVQVGRIALEVGLECIGLAVGCIVAVHTLVVGYTLEVLADYTEQAVAEVEPLAAEHTVAEEQVGYIQLDNFGKHFPLAVPQEH